MKKLSRVLTVLAVSIGFAGCVGDDYDLSKDVDLTMGLGSEGLAIRIGTTEKILLGDILDVDKSVKTDRNNIYYLTESGTTDMDFHVAPVTASFKNANLYTEQSVVVYDDLAAILGTPAATSVTVPKDFETETIATGFTDDFTFHVDDVEQAVVSISRVEPEDGTRIILSLDLVQGNCKFQLNTIKNVTIKMPDYLVIKSVDRGTVDGKIITIPELDLPQGGVICNVYAEAVELGEDGVIPADRTLSLTEERCRIDLRGEFSVHAAQDFTMQSSDEVKVRMRIVAGAGEIGQKSEIGVKEVTGVFDPEINLDIKPINVGDNLPDFLEDEEVCLDVANPTLSFYADLTDIPLSLCFHTELEAVKGATSTPFATVRLPEESDGEVEFRNNAERTIYFHQAASPYTPDGFAPMASDCYQVAGISKLLSRVPDRIDVQLDGGRIHVNQLREHTIQFGRDYHASVRYDANVPFEFNGAIKIVYRDSTDSMIDDLCDYEADGVRVTATALNTVPLALTATITPVDVNGDAIEGAQVTKALVARANEDGTESQTEIEIGITFAQRSDLSRVDRLLFRIEADPAEAQGTSALASTQYLILKDIRMRLTGQIVGNFN